MAAMPKHHINVIMHALALHIYLYTALMSANARARVYTLNCIFGNEPCQGEHEVATLAIPDLHINAVLHADTLRIHQLGCTPW